MAGLQARDLSIDEAATFYGVSGSTIRSRLRAGELRSVKTLQGEPLVHVNPLEDLVRLPDAATMLGVATSTLRAQVTRGELAGRRVDGKWRVRLVSVLEDPRVDPRVVELFGGSPAPPAPATSRPRSPSLHRTLFVRVYGEDVELAERLRDRHGSYTAAVTVALRAIDDETAIAGDAVAELRSELLARQEQLERVRTAHRGLSERARERLVDELYCPACEQLVAIEEFVLVDVDGGQELVHEGHRHRHGSKLRPGTVAARRRGELSPGSSLDAS